MNTLVRSFGFLAGFVFILLLGTAHSQPQIPQGFDLSKLSPEQQKMAKAYMSSKKKRKKITAKITKDQANPTENSTVSTQTAAKKSDTPLSTIEQIYTDKDPFNLYTLPDLYAPGTTLEEIESDRLRKATTLMDRLQTQTITQFGYSIFSQQQDAELNIPVSDDYILGPGDSLLIHVWGKFSNTFDVEIDNTGKIFIPQIGPVVLSGVQYKNAKQLIKQSLSRKFTNFELSISMGELKSIKVFVLGEVARPGAYDVSSLSTLFTALAQAGGPSKTGSLRNIKLMRNKKTVNRVDLYRYLINGDNSQDPKLQAYDTIFIPPIKGVIKVAGMVKRPGIFELKRETSAYDVLERLAGGFWAASYEQLIRIERIQNGQKRVLITLNTKNPKKVKQMLRKTTIQDGDLIEVTPILDQKFNLVTIKGDVYRPGSYQFRSDMTLADLLNEAEGRLPSAMDRVELFRFISKSNRELIILDVNNESDRQFVLNEYDIINVLPTPQEQVFVFGAVTKQGQFLKLHNMSVGDLLQLSFPERYAELSQLELVRKNESSSIVIPLNGYDILMNPNTTQNIQLQADDQLFVRASQERIKAQQIMISGRVKYPGVYGITKNESLANIIKRAGGLLDNADLMGTTLTRKRVQQSEKTEQELILAQERKRILYDRTQGIEDAIQPSDMLSALDDMIARKVGRVKLNFENTDFIIALEGDDQIHIPQISDSVSLFGGVVNPSAIQYSANRSVHDYIRLAGGFSEFADQGRVYVFKKDGSVVLDTRQVESGDSIFVGERFELPNRWLDTISSWTQVIVNSVTAYALVKSLQ